MDASLPSARIRRRHVHLALVAGALGLTAYAGGAWLGRFTVAGLIDETHERGDADTLAQAVVQLGVRGSSSTPRPVRSTVVEDRQIHVCEGCDVHLYPDTEFDEILTLYDEEPGEGDPQDYRNPPDYRGARGYGEARRYRDSRRYGQAPGYGDARSYRDAPLYGETPPPAVPDRAGMGPFAQASREVRRVPSLAIPKLPALRPTPPALAAPRALPALPVVPGLPPQP